jgi:hypothetical protein
MAAFCLLTGVSPESYLSLTRIERAAFVRLATRKR